MLKERNKKMKADLDKLLNGFGRRIFLGGVLALLKLGTEQALTISKDDLEKIGKSYDKQQLWKKSSTSRDEVIKCHAIAHDIALICEDNPCELLQYVIAENLISIKGYADKPFGDYDEVEARLKLAIELLEDDHPKELVKEMLLLGEDFTEGIKKRKGWNLYK